MNLKTYLQNVQARLENATPGKWAALNYMVYAQSKPGTTFEIPLIDANPNENDLPHEECEANADLIANCPTDLSTLLQIVKIQNDALSRFEYIDEVWALEKKDIYDIARQAIEQVNKLVSGGE